MAPANALVALVALLALAVPLAGCGSEEPAVAEVRVEPAEMELPYPQRTQAEVTWEPQRALDPAGDEPLVFVHLVNEDGYLLRTFDHPYPVTWRPGTTHAYPVDLYQSLLGPPLPAGDYRLTLGLYGPAGRWPLEAGRAEGKREYVVARVRVPEPDLSRIPRIDFPGGWEPLKPGADRQILGTRWLTTAGEIQIGATSGAGELIAVLQVPEELPGSRRELEEGAESPKVEVECTCDESERTITGAGTVDLRVQVPAGGDCRVVVDPNFRFVEEGSEVVRSVQLSQLFWMPEAGQDGGGS